MRLKEVNQCKNHEQRMCRLFLSNTTISIEFGNYDLETVEPNIGSRQGDTISGPFFNIEFENALRSSRERMNKARSQVTYANSEKSSLPTDLEYANDSDFPFESKRSRTPGTNSERNTCLEKFKSK